MTDLDCDLAARLRRSAGHMAVELSSEQVERLERYLDTLMVWRRRMSLVADRAVAKVVVNHVEDSLALVPVLHSGDRVADLGAGGGFPGLVLAIACPHSEIFLVEAQRRKASFLREALRASATSNAVVVEGRAEAICDPRLTALDCVVSRATWPGVELFAIARSLLRSGGLAVGMKSVADLPLDPPEGYRELRSQTYALSNGSARALAIATRK